MKIAIDAMGGDNAPLAILEGAKLALTKDNSIELILVGNPDIIRELWKDIDSEKRVSIVPAMELIEMGEHPAMAYRRKKDASITVATKLVKEGLADAVISAGSTGAQLVAALFGLGRIKGVIRPALATFFPTVKGPKLMLDLGANTDTEPANLVQFAWFGSIYSEYALGIKNPEVWLLSNGTEEEKGDKRTQDAHKLLKEEKGINFKGNVESREVLSGDAQVIVTDGFVGNMTLKAIEGTAKYLFKAMKKSFMSDIRSKIGAFLLKPALLDVKAMLDSDEYGGAPLLGVNGLSVVCHGSSNAKAICQAILKSREWVESGFLEKLKEHDFTQNVNTNE